MHATDGASREQSREDNSPPLDSAVTVDADKGEYEHQDGHEKRGDGEGGRVGDLESWLAVEHVDGSVANEVLCPVTSPCQQVSASLKLKRLVVAVIDASHMVVVSYHGPDGNATHCNGSAD